MRIMCKRRVANATELSGPHTLIIEAYKFTVHSGHANRV